VFSLFLDHLVFGSFKMHKKNDATLYKKNSNVGQHAVLQDAFVIKLFNKYTLNFEAQNYILQVH